MENTDKVLNAQFIEVKKCCASCEHRDILQDGTRVCKLMQIIRGQKDMCRQWEMSEGLKYAGRGFGRVRSKEYLDFVIAVRIEETYDIEDGLMLEEDRASLEDIRKRYNELHGSIYLIY